MLTVERLKELLHYDPDTGDFTWRESRGRVSKGSKAGSKRNCSGWFYLTIRVDGKIYYAHRLAVLYMTGKWPEEYVDHIDGDGLNNKWSNLREATNSQNQANQGVKPTNLLGVKGVQRNGSGYGVRLGFRGKTICLGTYPTIEEASAAYQEAAKRYFGEFAKA